MSRFPKMAAAAFALLVMAANLPHAAADPTVLDSPDPTSLTAYAARASLWLGQALDDGDGLAHTADGQPDYASTAYAILALTQMGYGADQIQNSAKALAQAGDAFIGTPDQADTKTSALALFLLSAYSANLDLTGYSTASGPRDPASELRSTIRDDGHVGEPASVYSQAFAILALTTTPGGVPANVLSWLLTQRCANQNNPNFGGFGFSAGSCDDTDSDSTALAIRALVAGDPKWDEDAVPSVNYLVHAQKTSQEGALADEAGGFAASMTETNANSTGLAAWALGSFVGVPQDDVPTQALANAQTYLENLAFACDTVQADGTVIATEAVDQKATALMGAIAYDTATREKIFSAGLTDETQASLMGSTAQAALGLGPWTTILPNISVGVQSDLPTSGCPVPAAASTQDTVSDGPTHTDNWLYLLGGVILVLGVFLGWRFLTAQRRH